MQAGVRRGTLWERGPVDRASPPCSQLNSLNHFPLLTMVFSIKKFHHRLLYYAHMLIIAKTKYCRRAAGRILRIEGGVRDMPETRTFKCYDCHHEWTVPCGTGRPLGMSRVSEPQYLSARGRAGACWPRSRGRTASKVSAGPGEGLVPDFEKISKGGTFS